METVFTASISTLGVVCRIANESTNDHHRNSYLSKLDFPISKMVEVNGIEPMTSCLQSTRSPN
jgi:hypothetical protein